MPAVMRRSGIPRPRPRPRPILVADEELGDRVGNGDDKGEDVGGVVGEECDGNGDEREFEATEGVVARDVLGLVEESGLSG